LQILQWILPLFAWVTVLRADCAKQDFTVLQLGQRNIVTRPWQTDRKIIKRIVSAISKKAQLISI
jgi:hypothetical protein